MANRSCDPTLPAVRDRATLPACDRRKILAERTTHAYHDRPYRDRRPEPGYDGAAGRVPWLYRCAWGRARWRHDPQRAHRIPGRELHRAHRLRGARATLHPPMVATALEG